jgi:transcriptional regulator with XRE-family HTH domain
LKHRYSQRHNKLRTTLREARLAAGLTQAQLCKRLKRNRLFVSQIETGTVMLDVLEFIEYAEALGLDPRKTFGKLLK